MADRKKRRKQVIPKDESKVERFKRVVTPRIDKALKAINQIGLCAGATYESTALQQTEIVNALDKAIDSVKRQFDKQATPQAGFSFTK